MAAAASNIMVWLAMSALPKCTHPMLMAMVSTARTQARTIRRSNRR